MKKPLYFVFALIIAVLVFVLFVNKPVDQAVPETANPANGLNAPAEVPAEAPAPAPAMDGTQAPQEIPEGAAAPVNPDTAVAPAAEAPAAPTPVTPTEGQ